MGQEHLQATLPAAPEQDPGTRAPRFVGRHTHLLARASGSRHIFSGPRVSRRGPVRARDPGGRGTGLGGTETSRAASMSRSSAARATASSSATSGSVSELSGRPPASNGWRKLVLGDWGRIVRDPLDVMRIAYFVGTIVWVATDGAAADGLVGASLVLLGGRVLNLPRFYDLSLIIGMTLTGWGSALHLYGNYGWYDNVVHALMPALMTRSSTSCSFAWAFSLSSVTSTSFTISSASS